MCIWDVLNVNANRMKSLLRNIRRCSNHIFLLEQLENYQGEEKPHAKTVALSDTANWQTKGQSRCTKFEVLAWLIINSKKGELESIGELSKVCSQIVFFKKCLYLERIGRPGHSKVSQSYIHHTSDHRQYCHVSNTAQHCRLGLFQDSDFAGDLEDSKNPPRERGLVHFRKPNILFPLVGCARRKHLSPTVLQNPKSFRWILDCEWMDYLLSIYGMW